MDTWFKNMEKIILRNITLTSIKTIHLIVANIIQCKYIIYRFSQAWKRSSHFFSQLEPRSPDSKPSTLTTGLLNKAVALVYLRYSWPCMFKVASCAVVWSYGHSIITSKFFQLDGLLLFCIIMGYTLQAPLSSNTTPMLLNFWWKFHCQRSSHKS